MNKKEQQTTSNHNSEHGTVVSYIIGFLLSLIFTFIPYYMVVNRSLSGNGLLATVLGYAVLQMFIQVFFFLHLGRGPKPLYNILFFAGTVGIIIVTVGGALFIMSNLYRNMSPGEVITRQAQQEGIYQVEGNETGACGSVYQNHVVNVSGEEAVPDIVEAKLCDSISLINEGDSPRQFLFGTYPESSSYGGEFEFIVRAGGYPKNIVLNELGEFQMYDQANPNVSVQFKVSP